MPACGLQRFERCLNMGYHCPPLAGDYGGGLAQDEKISITSKDEVGVLVQALTEMSKEIRNSYEKPDDYRSQYP